MLDKFTEKLDATNPRDMPDRLAAAMQQDIARFQGIGQAPLSTGQLSEKIQSYEDMRSELKSQVGGSSPQQQRMQELSLQLSNNLVYLKCLQKKDNFAESSKLLDQCIQINQQLPDSERKRELALLLLLNKLTVFLNKSKLSDCAHILKTIEKQFSEAKLVANKSYLQGKVSYLLKAESAAELEQFMSQMLGLAKGKDVAGLTRLLVFLVMAEVHRMRSEQQRILDLFMSLRDVDKVLENEIVFSLIFSLLTNNKQLFESNGPIIDKLATSSNIQILEQICEIYKKKNDTKRQIQIKERIIQMAPQQAKYRLELAQVYSSIDPKRAEQLTSDLPFPFQLIEDYNELEKLQSDLVLSKLKQDEKELKKEEEKTAPGQKGQIDQTKQIKKKQKKKHIRLPKNFDPSNPGPLPNPERWLPKWQRKEFRKKKDKFKNRTQGSAMVGQETVSTIQTKTQQSSMQKNQKKKRQK